MRRAELASRRNVGRWCAGGQLVRWMAMLPPLGAGVPRWTFWCAAGVLFAGSRVCADLAAPEQGLQGRATMRATLLAFVLMGLPVGVAIAAVAWKPLTRRLAQGWQAGVGWLQLGLALGALLFVALCLLATLRAPTTTRTGPRAAEGAGRVRGARSTPTCPLCGPGVRTEAEAISAPLLLRGLTRDEYGPAMRAASRLESPSHKWAVVLAAGEGQRLRALTGAVPKQFCRLVGERSLLQLALARSRRLVPPERTLVIVAEQHERHWSRELAGHPRENVLVQPANRGTAAGLLLPLLTALERDPLANVAVLPSDHYVGDEPLLARAFRGALSESRLGRILLLGIAPSSAETGYGWILPGEPLGSSARVASFIEKPDPHLARACLERGAVWNSFLIAAQGQALLELFRLRAPALVADFEAGLADSTSRREALSRLYDRLEPRDFSRDVLQGSEAHLRLRLAPSCGWTDLGTPERVQRCMVESAGRRNHARSGGAARAARVRSGSASRGTTAIQVRVPAGSADRRNTMERNVP